MLSVGDGSKDIRIVPLPRFQWIVSRRRWCAVAVAVFATRRPDFAGTGRS
jgi:hypothetical protein